MRAQPRTFQPFERFEGLVPENIPILKQCVSDIIHSRSLVFDQQRAALAGIAAHVLPHPVVSLEARELIDKEIIDMIGEPGSPFYPRYVAPFYDKLLREGSAFMELKAATDLHEGPSSYTSEGTLCSGHVSLNCLPVSP